MASGMDPSYLQQVAARIAQDRHYLGADIDLESAKIEALLAQITSTREEILALRNGIGNLTAPQSPADPSNAAQQALYQQQKAAYDSQVAGLRNQIARLNERIEKDSVEIEKTMRAIDQKIAAADTSAEERRRLETQREQLDQERKQLEEKTRELNNLEKAGKRLAVENRNVSFENASLKELLSVLSIKLYNVGDEEERARSQQNRTTGVLSSAPTGLGLDTHQVSTDPSSEELGVSAQGLEELKDLRSHTTSYLLEETSRTLKATTSRDQPVGSARERTALGDAPVTQEWTSWLNRQRDPGKMNVQGIIDHVMRESYLESNRELFFFAKKVEFFNKLKKAYRDEVTRVTGVKARLASLIDPSTNKVKANLNDTEKTQLFGILKDLSTLSQYSDIPDSNGQPQALPEAQRENIFKVTGSDGYNLTLPVTDANKESNITNFKTVANVMDKLDATIKGLDAKLASVGEDAQLANVDLQNMVQKQTLLIQMISNLSKAWYEIARGVTSKIGG
jgi:hypothetical protein